MIQKNTLAACLAAFSLMLALSAIAFGKGANPNFPTINIKNFGQMNERFYRGAQPKQEDYKSLSDLGIKTVIDLRDDPQDYEKPAVEALGMRYVNIPMDDKGYPKAEQIATFLKLVDDQATGKFYVHCAGGRHRTGVMGAVYRFTHDHWNYDQAYAEMKQYDFYTTWGHGPLKQFIQDYWNQLQTVQPVATAAKSVATAAK